MANWFADVEIHTTDIRDVCDDRDIGTLAANMKRFVESQK